MKTTLLILALTGGTALAGLTSCDPVHDDAVDALGPEAPGVRKGPTHRAGQPCITCHDGSLGSPPHFTVAGTVYMDATSETGASGVTVKLTSADGTQHAASTNTVGNFYVSPKQFTPVYPMLVELDYAGTQVKMTSHVGRDGSCADCHTKTAGPTSAGRVFLNGVVP